MSSTKLLLWMCMLIVSAVSVLAAYNATYRVEVVPALFVDFIATVPVQTIGSGLMGLIMLGINIIIISTLLFEGTKWIIHKIEEKK